MSDRQPSAHRLGRVFVSSVFGGMMETRAEVGEAICLLGLAPVLTETHVAQPNAVKAALEREVAACDTYVGLFDIRRGTVPPSGTRDGRAITEEEFSRFLRAGIQMLWGRLLAQQGKVQEAEQRLQAALAGFSEGEHERERAVTLGDIARRRAQAGDVEEARRLQTERLEVNRGLGDVDGIAAAQFDLAQLDFAQEKAEGALPRLAEAWQILQRIERLDGIATVGGLLGRLLAARGAADQARPILSTAASAWRSMGREEQAQELETLLGQLEGESSTASARSSSPTRRSRWPWGWLHRRRR